MKSLTIFCEEIPEKWVSIINLINFLYNNGCLLLIYGFYEHFCACENKNQNDIHMIYTI